MSYRNPRFSYRHMLREFKAAGIEATSNAATSGAVENLYDDRKAPRATWIGSTIKTLRIIKNAVATAAGGTLESVQLNRVMLVNSNFTNDRAVSIGMDAAADMLSTVFPELLDGVAYQFIAPSSGLLDLELNIADSRLLSVYLELKMYTAMVTANEHGMGELWWTNTVQPTTGVAHRWNDTVSGIYDRVEGRSGSRYTQKRGQPKWGGGIEHRGLSGADLKLYDDMYLYTQQGQFPFWFEHPDSGDAELLLDDWSAGVSTAIFTKSSGSVIAYVAARPDGGGGSIVRHSGGSIVKVSWIFPVASTQSGVGTSFAGKILRVQVKPSWGSLAASDIVFGLVSSLGSGNTAVTNYHVGGCFKSAGSDWYRLEIDLDAQATDFIGGEGPADLNNVSHFGFEVDRPTLGDTIDFGDFYLVDKAKQPKLVEITSYARTQDSSNPSSQAGPTYTIRMGLLEVTT